MSPAVAKPKPEPKMTTAPEVAAAIQRQQDADTATTNKHLAAYREAVRLAATRQPILATVADSAVVAAHHLGLPAGRMDTDIAAMRTAVACERRMEDYTAKSADRQARSQAIRQELREAEQRLRALRAEAYRLSVAHTEWVNAKQQRDEVTQQRPHLFRDASQITEAQWRHVRA